MFRAKIINGNYRETKGKSHDVNGEPVGLKGGPAPAGTVAGLKATGKFGGTTPHPGVPSALGVTVTADDFTAAGIANATADQVAKANALANGGPTAEQLASDVLDVEGLAGGPWPGSTGDRHGKGSGQNARRLDMLEGRWPTEKERTIQIACAIRAVCPEKYARERLADLGVEDKQVEAAIRSKVLPLVRRDGTATAPITPPKPKQQAAG